MSNPYGGSGSIVVPPRQVRGTSTRLGSRGWRLTDTTHGKAMRRKRTARAGERILPTLSDEEADMIMARLSDKEADTIISTLNREEVDIVMARTHGIEGRDSRLARLEERREAFNKSLPSIHTD